MVSSKKVHCAYCQKKCSGSVLRYQDRYYHKQCFESLQTELAEAQSSNGTERQRPEIYVESEATSKSGENKSNILNKDLDTRTRDTASESETPTPTKESHQYYHSRSTKKTTTTTTRQQKLFEDSDERINKTSLLPETSGASEKPMSSASYLNKGHTLDSRPTHLSRSPTPAARDQQPRSATLPHSISSPSNGFLASSSSNLNKNDQQTRATTQCAGCNEKIRDGQALIALDLHWHVWCFRCSQCKTPLHGEYVAKDGRAYCEKDYQKLFGITCVYCKRYITGKVLQAGDAHHFHPSCARCSKCGDPFVPGEEMYLQGEVTWHPRCGLGPNGIPLLPGQMNESSPYMGQVEGSAIDSSQLRSQLRSPRGQSPSLSSRSRSASPYSFMSRQNYGRNSPGYPESEAVGDLSRIYTISYLNADPNQGYLKRPLEPYPPKSPQFSRPTSLSRINGVASDRSRCSSRSQQLYSSSSTRDRSVPPPRGMYSVLSSMGRSGTSSRARSPSMMNEEPIQLAAYPSGQKPSPDAVPKIERDDFPAPPFPYPNQHRSHRARGQSAPRATSGLQEDETKSKHVGDQMEQPTERVSRPRSREFTNVASPNGKSLADRKEEFPSLSSSDDDTESVDPQFRKEEEELSKIANGIGKIFLQTLKEREKLRAWKRSHLDPRNASRTPSATREIPSRPLRYDNPSAASPSRDLNRPRPWDSSDIAEDITGDHSPTRTRSSLSKATAVGATPRSAASSTYGYKVVQANRETPKPGYGVARARDHPVGTSALMMMNGGSEMSFGQQQRAAQFRAPDPVGRQYVQQNSTNYVFNRPLASSASAHMRRSMPNVANARDSAMSRHQHLDGPPKLYPYHLLATTNYRLPPDVDRCHLERHLSNEEFQYIFHCDRLDFYRLPEWKRNELKRRAKLF